MSTAAQGEGAAYAGLGGGAHAVTEPVEQEPSAKTDSEGCGSLQRMVRRRWLTLAELHAELGEWLVNAEYRDMPVYVKAGDALRELGSVIMWASPCPNGSGYGWVCLLETRKAPLVRLGMEPDHQAQTEATPAQHAPSTHANTEE